MTGVNSQQRFLFKQTLGAGAFGVVYLGEDLLLRQPVAIKVPHDKDKERALRKEAQLMARIGALHEPHVVRLQDVHELDGKLVLVMEYVEGAALRTKLGEIGKQLAVDSDEALCVALQVCKGLQSLHEAFQSESIFHRDIKPENLLLRQVDSFVKIADFGIAKVMVESGSVGGTPPYMSPQAFTGKQLDFRTDIYGLGVTLYELLTGRLPYSPWRPDGTPKAPLEFADDVCNGPLPPAPQDIADVERELSDIVVSAMSREVNRRYQSARELGDALEDLQARLSVDSAIAAAWKEPDSAARERCLREIVNRFPRSPNGHRNLAWFLNGQLRIPEAVAALEEGRVQCRDCGELLVDLALAYDRVGKARQAIDTLEEARRKGLPPDVEQRTKPLLTAWRRRL